MRTLPCLPEDSTSAAIKSVTIGNFDGVHIGHQKILHETVRLARQLGGPSAAISFSNHPSTILRPGQHPLLLCTPEHKLKLMAETGLDQLFLMPFTKELSELSPCDFLTRLTERLHMDCLVLGADATLGKGKQGDRKTIEQIARQLSFQVHYLPDCLIEGQRVSSSLIRQLIQKGRLQQAASFLGRTYSIYAQVVPGAGRGKALGFHTANISIQGLCLPPLGVYAVKLLHQGLSYPGVANLGYAPTFRSDQPPLLEVHLWGQQLDLSGQYVEVLFHQYLRPERRFADIEELIAQIQKDILSAKSIISTLYKNT